MSKRTVKIALADKLLEDVTAELLASAGFDVVQTSAGKRVHYLVADPASASEALRDCSGATTLLVNVSGPGALAGALARIRVARYIARPASAKQILSALSSVADAK